MPPTMALMVTVPPMIVTAMPQGSLMKVRFTTSPPTCTEPPLTMIVTAPGAVGIGTIIVGVGMTEGPAPVPAPGPRRVLGMYGAAGRGAAGRGVF